MFHKDRRWWVEPVNDARELAQMVMLQKWPLCSGFRLGEYVYLNDSVSETTAVEFTTVKEVARGEWVEIDTVTFGWLNLERSFDVIEAIQRGEHDSVWNAKIRPPVLESRKEHGGCDLCR